MDDKLTDHGMDNESVLKIGRIIKLNDDLAVVIVDEDKIIDMEMVSEYHEWIQDNMNGISIFLIIVMMHCPGWKLRESKMLFHSFQ